MFTIETFKADVRLYVEQHQEILERNKGRAFKIPVRYVFYKGEARKKLTPLFNGLTDQSVTQALAIQGYQVRISIEPQADHDIARLLVSYVGANKTNQPQKKTAVAIFA